LVYYVSFHLEISKQAKTGENRPSPLSPTPMISEQNFSDRTCSKSKSILAI